MDREKRRAVDEPTGLGDEWAGSDDWEAPRDKYREVEEVPWWSHRRRPRKRRGAVDCYLRR